MVDWFYIGYCTVMAMFVVAFSYAAAFGFRALRRLPRSLLLGFAAAATVATLTAQKTNNVPPNMNQPQMQQGGGSFQTGFTGLAGFAGEGNLVNLVNPVQTTSGDIASGWRVESVATNEAVLYAMPTNATLVGNWHVHGASSSFGNNMVDFGVVRTSGTLVPTNWAFPIGTNNAAVSSFWYFIDSRIRPTPKDTMREICAVGVPMSAVPGQSRLWRFDGDDGSRILTWENFFLGGDTNCPVNAQIVLRPNGDFITRSNDVETVCRRVNPDDWDDDGIHNERDANPTSCDGDFFGVANALPPNANPNAYYWLDMSATGALGVATIRVTCDGPSDLGDHVIIARTNQVCRIPLLAGATYAVDSNLPIDYSAVSSESAEIVTNAEDRLTVSLPLELSFERVQMRGGSDNYIAHSSPVDVGPRILNITGSCCSCMTNENGFSWNCFPQCHCGGSEHSLSGAAKWEGYSYPFFWWGRCHCYYEDQTTIDEIESRGVSLEILDASGNAIEWKYPVLVGESVIVQATVGGSEMTLSDFVGLFGGRIRLKAYYVDFVGEHDIAGAAIPISMATTTSQGQNVFRVSVAADWLQSNGLVRNADDEIVAKTSIDMVIGPDGGSDRTDSDHFDGNVSGRLYGRARGRWGGDLSASIPEGEFNLKTVQAAGTACLCAIACSAESAKKQCQQQADVFYYSGHGTHDTGALYEIALPSDVSNRWHDVDAVVFAGCAVLDIGDRNNNYTKPASHTASPGLKWAAASGAGVLIGYAYYAPLDDKGGMEILEAWCGQRSALGDIEAWMRANDRRCGHNACAIRKIDGASLEYHYFVKRARLYWSRQIDTVQQGE